MVRFTYLHRLMVYFFSPSIELLPLFVFEPLLLHVHVQ